MNGLALLFPGQGSQYVGMGKELHERHAFVRQLFEEANDVLGFDLRKLMFEGDQAELSRTDNAQPAILTASAAAFRVYMHEHGIAPMLSAGHSLGEFTALACAGAIAFTDALQLVRLRGTYMRDSVPAGTGTMAAVLGASMETVEAVCSRLNDQGLQVQISNINAGDQLVVSGMATAVEQLCGELREMRYGAIQLNVSGPFHSPLMMPAMLELEKAITGFSFAEPKWPVISNVTAEPHTSREDIPGLLLKQMLMPVQWQASIRYMKEHGVSRVIELGPKSVLKNLMKQNAPDMQAYAFDVQQDRDMLAKQLMEISRKTPGEKNPDAAFPGGMEVLAKCLAFAASTRNRNWNAEDYREGVVRPYGRIRDLYIEREAAGVEPTYAETMEAVRMLERILLTKKLPESERQERLGQVYRLIGGQELPEERMGDHAEIQSGQAESALR